MSEPIQINAQWQVVTVEGAQWGRGRAWLLQRRMVDGAWHDVGATRSREMLIWLIGPVDDDAAAILGELPLRSDLGRSPPKPPGKRARAAAPASPPPSCRSGSPAPASPDRFRMDLKPHVQTEIIENPSPQSSIVPQAQNECAEKTPGSPATTRKRTTGAADMAAAFLTWRAEQAERPAPWRPAR
jgi:hypothetical protein